jgi:hypothetical protein
MQRVKIVLLYGMVIFIGGSVSSWVVVNVLLKPSPQTEAPELVYAKTQAQLAELARNQESNIFWGHFFQWVGIFMFLVLIAGAGTAIFIVWRGFVHKIYVEEIQLRFGMSRLKPDGNGNYDGVRLRNGEYLLPPPGNPGVPGPAQQVTVLEEPRGRSARRLKLNSMSGPFSIKWDEEIPPTQPAPSNKPNTNFEANEQPERTNTEHAMRESLIAAWERGEAKTVAIPRITGAKRGDNKGWKYWSETWDKF